MAAAKGYFLWQFPEAIKSPSFYHNSIENVCVLSEFFDASVDFVSGGEWKKYSVNTTSEYKFVGGN